MRLPSFYMCHRYLLTIPHELHGAVGNYGYTSRPRIFFLKNREDFFPCFDEDDIIIDPQMSQMFADVRIRFRDAR